MLSSDLSSKVQRAMAFAGVVGVCMLVLIHAKPGDNAGLASVITSAPTVARSAQNLVREIPTKLGAPRATRGSVATMVAKPLGQADSVSLGKESVKYAQSEEPSVAASAEEPQTANEFLRKPTAIIVFFGAVLASIVYVVKKAIGSDVSDAEKQRLAMFTIWEEREKDDRIIPEFDIASLDWRWAEPTLKEFPEKGIANVEEAALLVMKGGYTYLDVRSTFEADKEGKAKLATLIPMIELKKKYNTETQQTDFIQEVNKDWLNKVRKAFPNKDSKICIGCSNSRDRAIQALEALDGDGYTHIVGMQGGFNKWDATFDSSMRRRNVGVATEVDGHIDQMGDVVAGCGIHASGAGGTDWMVDPLPTIVRKDPISEWNQWRP